MHLQKDGLIKAMVFAQLSSLRVRKYLTRMKICGSELRTRTSYLKCITLHSQFRMKLIVSQHTMQFLGKFPVLSLAHDKSKNCRCYMGFFACPICYQAPIAAKSHRHPHRSLSRKQAAAAHFARFMDTAERKYKNRIMINDVFPEQNTSLYQNVY